jgi:glycosyltransferase involved in cell wall biosynthesis
MVDVEFNPMVSVIVTSYNQEETVAMTLDCILNQKCDFLFEIIIGDDYSTDKTRMICLDYQKSYPDKIKLSFQESNGGVAKNFVTAMKLARGKYIGICAADDYWHNPEKLKIQVDFFENNPDYGLIYTEYNVLDMKTGRIEKNFLRSRNKQCLEGGGLVTEVFKGNVPILTHTVLFRKEIYDKYCRAEDYIKFNFPIEDWPTWLIISKYSKIKYMPVATSTYRRARGSMSNPKEYEKIERKYAAEQKMYKYLCERFTDELHYNEQDYSNYVDAILLNLAYLKHDFKAARTYAQRLIQNGYRKKKVRMAANRLTFNLFYLLKKLRGKLSE